MSYHIFHAYCTKCKACGANTSKAYARTHGGKCKACVTGAHTLAAEAYAIVTTDVDVVEVDSAGKEIGEHQSIPVEIAVN